MLRFAAGRVNAIALQSKQASMLLTLRRSYAAASGEVRFTAEHDWVRLDGTDKAVVGITDFAQQELGEIVYVELPTVDTEITAHGGTACAVVESVKAASDISAPVTGVVSEINETLRSDPGLLNRSPEADGWLFKVKLSDPSQFKSLLDRAAYDKHCESSHH